MPARAREPFLPRAALGVLALALAACSEVPLLPVPGAGGGSGGSPPGSGAGPGHGGGAQSSSSGGGASPAAPDLHTAGATPQHIPTYHEDVAPLLAAHCTMCHAPGRIGPFSLLTLDEARTVAALSAKRAAERTMPPWGAEPTSACAPRFGWKNDLSLTDAEIDVLQRWADTGMKAGDPAAGPAPSGPPIDDEPLDSLDMTLAPEVPFSAGGDDDQFRCFTIDPGLTGPRFVNGIRIVGGVPSIIHHVTVLADPQGLSAGFADESGGYACEVDAGVGTQVLVNWTPGSGKTQLPPGAGFPLKPGTRLVMQIHYHPAGAPTVSDSTKIELDFLDGPPAQVARLIGAGNVSTYHLDGTGLLPGPNDFGPPIFLVPAGVRGHTETITWRVPSDKGGAPLPEMAIYEIKPHMHFAGEAITLDIHRPSPAASEPADECLVGVPRWDFRWQRAYAYDAPVVALPTIHSGDEMTVRCTYDNTVDNQALVEQLLRAHLPGPVDIHLGQKALDEMCFAAITVLAPASP